ncbi:carbohydrate kinase [Pedobacter sp. G11]|uniref:PfkB family carbohydrate kinase n=1 Tax=Pedobacter sp. G11 TaxID=2482728 RepID=UPI000F5FCB1D|nr:PfkB family carbohydrate kinase [Pedobacter sp. G11]AZI26348.1 carbohydrate kinase [Pedobacter sp. G11]
MQNNSTNTPMICFGEILWDVLPDGPQPGGAPMNVAYHLSKLGIKTGIISSVGKDNKGEKLLNLLDCWGIDRSLVQINTEQNTSQVVAKTNNKTEVIYEILFPVAWDFIKAEENALAQTWHNQYLIYGSLASRNEVSLQTLLGLMDTPSIKVMDVNLRYPFVKHSILEKLMTHADIIKLNDNELDKIQTIFNGTFGQESDKVKFIQDKFAVPEILVTKGEFGGSYYKENEAFHHFGSEVTVEDTIGSGDAFLAGFLANHMIQAPAKQMLREAIAMGGFVATKKGACADYSFQDYQNFKTEQEEKYLIS